MDHFVEESAKYSRARVVSQEKEATQNTPISLLYQVELSLRNNNRVMRFSVVKTSDKSGEEM